MESPPQPPTESRASRRLSFFGNQSRAPLEPRSSVDAGQIIGDYRLVRLIGEGGMGQVWEAVQLSLSRRVALKLVRPDRVSDANLALFAREARAGGRLQHPGIVAVYGHGESDGIAWIAMEFVEGSWTLRDFLDDVATQQDNPAIYYREVAHFIAKLADALYAAHEAGVIHRDLKPQNILIAPDESPKVTDFGLARITNESALSTTGDFAGTYYYMSPEQVAAKRIGLDHRTDIFSLGIVMYEMLALRRPFEGDTAAQIGQQIVTKEPPRLRSLRSRIPEDLAVICGKCLDKDRDRRYQSMAELATDLHRHLTNEPILAKPAGAARKLQLWCVRNPAKSATALVTALALVIISSLLLQNVRKNRRLTRTIGERDLAVAELTISNSELDDRARLSRQMDLRALVSDAEELWPPHPNRIADLERWIGKAEVLLGELPLHREQLSGLRQEALPYTDAARSQDRLQHPELPALLELESRIDAKMRSLSQRRDGKTYPLPPLTPQELTLDAFGASWVSWELVRPDSDRLRFGDEPRGLALALRALELAKEEEPGLRSNMQGEYGLRLAWAYFALGRDDDAKDAIAEAAARSDLGDRPSDLLDAIALAASETGLESETVELERLVEEREALLVRVNRRRSWQFPNTREGWDKRWWTASLADLIASLESLGADPEGLLSHASDACSDIHGWSVPRRLEEARRLQELPNWSRRWAIALAAIEESPTYGGLEIEPQVGLMPIGVDPDSGLWEFWHILSGVEPQRGPDGRLSPKPDCGIVLVLIPSGTFWMGATRDPDALHNHDAGALYNEGPVHEVVLRPYFLSKYELTRAQWQRLAGKSLPLRTFITTNQPVDSSTALLPATGASWSDYMRVLGWMDLTLPTEAQWEQCCRAGTDTPWWSGPDSDSLREHRAARIDSLEVPESQGGWAPVGSCAANPWGFHDIHGNVAELCRDGYDDRFYLRSPTQDPESPAQGAKKRALRDGAYGWGAAHARSSRRSGASINGGDILFGVRPARPVL